MPSARVAFLLGGVLLAAVSSLAHACQVPVFRYALERWEAANLGVAVFHKGPLGESDQAIIKALREFSVEGKGQGNYSVRIVDLDKARPFDRKLWEANGKGQTPCLIATYADAEPADPAAFVGPLEAVTVRALIDSPARRQIAKKILGGESAVWVLIESGNKAADETAAALLARELPRLQKELKLPEQDPDDSPRGEKINTPLRMAFSLVRISRTDPAEKPFADMLLNVDSVVASRAATQPVASAMFGRGRSACALVGEQIKPPRIEGWCEFLTGACSCQVKDQNPGTDIILAADWDALIENRVVKDPVLPPLTGLAQMASVIASATAPATTQSGQWYVTAASPATRPANQTGLVTRIAASSSNLYRNLIIMGVAGVLIIVGATFAMRIRSHIPRS